MPFTSTVLGTCRTFSEVSPGDRRLGDQGETHPERTHEMPSPPLGTDTHLVIPLPWDSARTASSTTRLLILDAGPVAAAASAQGPAFIEAARLPLASSPGRSDSP